jgi:DNA-binding NarL/FixJ family response regulator
MVLTSGIGLLLDQRLDQREATAAGGFRLRNESPMAVSLPAVTPSSGPHEPGLEGRVRLETAVAELTARELAVLPLLAEGLVNREIAQRLSISQETVKGHVSHLLTKLEARSRAHAVAIALRIHLII